MMAFGFTTSNSRVKRAGTKWQKKWHAVPRSAQVIVFKPKLDIAHKDRETRKTHYISNTCSLLRQVCGLSGWNSRSSELSASC